jgi:hypothetical protein
MSRTEPTIYPDLNEVLRELVRSAQAVLKQQFCGAYLQGSFAVGDFDGHSDVDFLIVTHDHVSAAQLPALQALHGRIYALDTTWAQHLEGSYIPKEALRHLDPDRSPYLYLDNGAARLIWSDHDNTAVVRWSLREHGVVLAGPAPSTLVDFVTSADLRHEELLVMREWAQELRVEDAALGNRWRQPHVVLSYCRMLHTLAIGRVTSKRVAARWAIGALDSRWAGLIEQAWAERPDPTAKIRQAADPKAVDGTWSFIDYALEIAAGSMPMGSAEP